MKRKFIHVFLLVALLITTVLVGCNNNVEDNMNEAKLNADANKGSLSVFLSFDQDKDPFYVGNVKDANEKFLIESLRNDVTSNKFFNEAKAAYRTKGVSGEALAFDGYTTSILLGNPFYGKKEFTIDLWMAIRAYDFVDSTRNITPLVEYYDASTDTGFIFGYTYHGKWGIRMSTINGEWVEVWADEYLDLYSWYNLTVTYADGVISLYKNGELVKEGFCIASEWTQNSQCNVGRNTYLQTQNSIMPNNYFAGLLDELKIYHKAISAADINKQAQLYLKDGQAPALTYEEMNYSYDYLGDSNYRTTWHGAPPINWISDINGGFYYNGKYHIFYTKSDLGPQLGGVSWGHMVSDDMIGWTETQPAIWCEDNGIDSRWVFAGSGGVVNDVPYIFYTGFRMNNSNQFVCTVSIATPKDLTDPNLTEWEKLTDVKLSLPSTGYVLTEYRDPQIYIEGDTVFLIIVSKTTSGNPCIVAWSADASDMTNWTWRGTVFEADYSSFKDSGYMWEVPIFLKLTSPDGNLTKWILAFAPMGGESNDSIYFMGEFDAETCRFTPDKWEVKRFDQGEEYFMCSGGEIYDPKTGQTVVFELIQCCWNLTQNLIYENGYSGVLSMGRVYGINNDGALTVKPIEGYDKLHGNTMVEINDKTASETDMLYTTGRSFHAQMILESSNETKRMGFELMSNKTGSESISFYYDCRTGEFVLSSFKSSNINKIESRYAYKLDASQPVTIDIYVDKSSIEIFVDGEFAMSSRVYNNLFCEYLKFIGEDWYIHSMKIYEMKSIWQ